MPSRNRSNKPVKKAKSPRVVSSGGSLAGTNDPGGLASTPTPATTSQQGSAVGFPACSPPDTRTGPQFVLPLRRPIVVSSFGRAGQLTIGGKAVDASLGLAARFEQTWNLTGLSIGDLSSTMSLAPSEQLTLEFQTTQRNVIDRDVLDSSESSDSSESTTSDKEAVNVVRSSSKTDNWHVDSTGTLTC